MATKKLYAIVTFNTTTDAMHTEKVCKSNGLSGRLIPVPRAISAGCGLSWREDIDNLDSLKNILKNNNIEYDAITQLEL